MRVGVVCALRWNTGRSSNSNPRVPAVDGIIGGIMSTRQANEVGSAGADLVRTPDRLLGVLLTVDLLLFAGGAVAHSGIPIPLGFGTWEEPLLVPAAIIEGVGAAGLLFALVAIAGRANWAYRICWWVLWYCFVGVLWGMVRLAVGSIPEAHTMTNDFLHIGMTLVTTVALVRLAKLHSSAPTPRLWRATPGRTASRTARRAK
jgi:hypothetical protein